jgi:methionyl-tRNA synthetase
MDIARLGNKYLADEEPWKVVKTDPERVKTILHICLQVTANLTIALEPFLPFSMNKVRRFLNMPQANWNKLGNTALLPAGHQLNPSELLFEKIEDDVIEKQVQKLLDTKRVNEAAQAGLIPAKPPVNIDQFGTMDIRTATVLAAERVAKTQKLMKLTVDTGLDRRTLVAGIAEQYTPEEMVGKQICILANLEPRPLKGIESKGMILCAQDPSGKLVIVTPEMMVKNGSVIK